MESAMFMIESGRPLEMVKEHIAERSRVGKEARSLIRELGVKSYSACRSTGVVVGVIFDGDVHADFTKPRGRDGVSFPKKKTEWHKRFAEQKGHADLSTLIAKEYGIPLTMNYKSESGHGWRRLGSPFNECGFLYLSEDGPYSMWVPDIPAEVARVVEQGYAVDESVASFKMEFDGCRRIEKEEWEILVLQNNLAHKKANAAA